MKKIIIAFLLTLITLFGTFQNTSAWLGLVGQNGDIIDVAKWNELIDALNLKLEVSNIIGGDDIDVVVSGNDVTLNYVGEQAIPYISGPINLGIPLSTSKDLVVYGLNFTPSTTVSIPGWPGSINSTTIDSPEQITINVTSTTTEADYDIVVNNGTLANTLWTGNGVGIVKVRSTGLWQDLRLGGDVFTHGNAAGNDIRYKTGMSLTRDNDGMYFSGVSPWSSWVKFESLAWTRGDNKTIEWITTQPSSNMMFGIGSDATDENNGAQYAQAETEVYFSNATTMWGLYGNNGTVGSAGNQSLSTSLTSCASQVFKTKMTNDGTSGSGIFTLYCLPSASIADWDDENTVMATVTIGGTMNPDEANIMPFITPTSGGTQRFVAVRVQ